MEKRNEQLEVLEDVHEMVTEALKLVANEPSVGLYFVQQHVHKAVPSLLNVKHQITEATASADLATADVKDSLSCIKSMKDCGPPVIERMIKTLQTASTQIPTNHQSRGSFSQLLPRPVRPPGLSKAPLRSSSFLGDWRSDSSIDKSWENYQRERPSGDARNKKGSGDKPALPFPDSKRAEFSQKKVTDLNQQEASSSAGCDSSGKIFDGYTTSVLAMLKAGNVS
ncbi:hypothetical protein GOP47_0006872 [Adiantum capillus-veneris]|uniref:Protein MEF2BNB n=1 Tax=Adiantum capillus-veneris TaxID=13818 RepID=A0A9D4V3Q6_ADICA|nr:hypothetical protein GOP47_0006872 [Adiantum capillus-veneris]